MKIDMTPMAEAMRLMRSGQLQAATARIQAALTKRDAADAAAPSTPPSDGDVIDVPSRVVSRDAPQSANAPSWFDATPRAPDAARMGPGNPMRSDVAATTARFSGGSFSNGRDRRDYKLYVPAKAGDRPLPLVVMLHGCTQDPDDFAAGTAMNEAAERHRFYVLYPAQSRHANPHGCWNWFKHTHQQRDRGEPALLAGMVRDVMTHHAVDARRVYVAGLSAGGAMAAILGDTYPELFAAVGVHSGLAAGSAQDLPSALAAMKGAGAGHVAAASGVPTIVFHGDSDATVHPRNGEHVIAACVDATARVETSAVRGTTVRNATRMIYRAADGRVVAERWVVHGAPHAWSGGRAEGSFTDTRGPDASGEMVRFFLEHPHAAELH